MRKKKREAFHVAVCGRERVSVYVRKTPTGREGFMVANYSAGKRRFDSYPSAAAAIEAASKLARQLSVRDIVAASMTNGEAIEFASAMQALRPHGLSLVPAITTLVEAVKLVGDLPSVVAAAKVHASQNREVKRKVVSDVVEELIRIKEARGAAPRYVQDLKHRLRKFAGTFKQDTCNVTTDAIQSWLDGMDLAPQSFVNFRRVLSLLFTFAKARGYAASNPVEGLDKVTVRGGEISIFKPVELDMLLTAARADFLPALAIAAFAGLRSAEIVRLEWSDIDLAGGHIVVSAAKSKTASRRIVPIVPALAEWLAPYANRKGRVWPRAERKLYQRQQETAATAQKVETKAAEKANRKPATIEWRHNALRHSFISYRLADVQDAAKVSLEAGNSPQMIFRHYRELVTAKQGSEWFNVRPDHASNVVRLRTTG